MAQRVLVFEKDANFVRELEEGFGRMGLSVETMRDADGAIAKTREGNVRLVLISVDAMGTPGEAFLVCKRFKSDDELARVPLVIMGGAQHAEAFDSHSKLKKRRADEYVQTPVGFDGLLQRISAVTGLSNESAPAPVEDEDVAFFEEAEEVEVSEAEPQSSPMDADIDAFAENAFGELLREDEPPQQPEPQFVSALHTESAPDVDQAELQRLRDDAAIASRRAQEAEQRVRENAAQLAEGQRKLEELAQRLAQVEQRAGQAEQAQREAERKLEESEQRVEAAERRAREASAAPPAPQPAGVSSRDYLDLREQLNRKDKELLALREQVTQRDRQLLDASDRSLSLEREQAELHDTVATTQRALDEAQGKIKTYETDREAVNKRLEDFRGRLSRAEEKGKRLEDELESLKNSSASEISALKTAHEQALAERERASAAEGERLRGEHATALSQLESKAQRELAEAQADRESQLASLRATHERALEELRAAHADELEARQKAHEADVEEKRSAAEARLESALAEASSERNRALAALDNERSQELERRMAEAERGKNAALAGLQRELETKAANERKELEDRHAAEVAALSSQLSETKEQNAQLEQRLAELDQAKTALDARLSARIGSLEGDLQVRTQERDTANNELSAMRASIASLERSGVQLNERLSALELDLGRANERIDQQNAKIATDKELLDRVRRALGIGIGLLEQQRNNVV